MSAKRWALSVFFVWHVIATGLGSLEPSGFELTVGPPRHPENDPIAATLTPALDSLAAVVAPALDGFIRAARPLGQLAAAYLDIIAVGQHWKMFSIPPNTNEYVRVRYYVGPRAATGQTSLGPVWTATELVMPAHHEDEVKLFQAYRDSFRDKAMMVARDRFRRNLPTRLIKPDTVSSELPDDLAPIARYFARRFQREALRSDEDILRTEIWFGAAPMPPPGTTPDPTRVEARLSVVRGYYDGPVEDHFARPATPVYHAAEEESDIIWVLEYFEP